MATYSYRCRRDGPLDTAWPVGTAPPTIPCPTCGDEAARLFTPPMLGLADRSRTAVIDRAERSRTEPEVVTAPPPRAPRPTPRPAPRLDPRTAALPRP